MVGDTGNIVTFEFSPRHAEKLVHELAEDTGRVVWEEHVKTRMAERDITAAQILRTLRRGRVVDGPKKDQYGDWRCKLRKRVAGRRVHVVVAIRGKEKLFVVTTY